MSAPVLSPEVTARWQARFRAPRVSLPDWALHAPQRCLYASDVSGVVEQYAWDRTTDAHRQATDRPNGTLIGTLSPDGETIWWFADTDGDEFGVWMVQPFAGGEDRVAVPEVGPAYPAGLEIGGSLVAIGRSTDDGSELWVAPVGGTPRVVYRHEDPASVDALTLDDDLLVVSHSEHGDPRYPALRVLRTDDDSVVAEKWDGEGRGLHALEFAPLPGDRRLLVGHERRGREELLVWDVAADSEVEIVLDLPGDVTAGWYPDGSALLVGHDHAARSELYRYDLGSGALERLDTPPGVVRGPPPAPTARWSWPGPPRPSRPSSAAPTAPWCWPLPARRRPRPTRSRTAGCPAPAGTCTPSSSGRPGRRRTRRRSWCTAAPRPPTTTPTAPAGPPTSTPATRSCTSTTAAPPATAAPGATR
ncbi:hypothetical protein JD79_00840 [Geodermatophilus normandii]|uniref:WD40 repeat protein n=1 Tax=Geodermatophilus normandii TaxID=1137989 RepID=A0A317QG21_9ACTN|nr:hypothetical protein JD79_00840 [Geodermatophilus normandii]